MGRHPWGPEKIFFTRELWSRGQGKGMPVGEAASLDLWRMKRGADQKADLPLLR